MEVTPPPLKPTFCLVSSAIHSVTDCAGDQRGEKVDFKAKPVRKVGLTAQVPPDGMDRRSAAVRAVLRMLCLSPP